MELDLKPSEVRVLGSLIEKQIVTPEVYPLTLNALVTACNQKTNREPVVNYDTETVERALAGLQRRGLARTLIEGGRVPKYAHVINQALRLGRPETAVFCLLMLRGAQTPGELRGRAGRIYEFGDIEEVEATLRALAEREEGALAVRLPRQPGAREHRWAHLLSGPVAAETEVESEPAAEESAGARAEGTVERQALAELTETVRALREEVAEIRRQFEEFRNQFK